MNDLQPTNFSDFFEAIYGYAPFPWQKMLVERVADRGWPDGIDLPTASGKTACIDTAVFLLAMGENKGRLSGEHPARRRTFFVVDRRIVVDEAYERARQLSRKLKESTNGIVKCVADRLRSLAGVESTEPLIVSRLRGGTIQDERWRLSPVQPAIITSTVDQIGSRLLFRSYGASNLLAPIDAALTACDSLILLDEVHCAVPFMQTARAVQRYAGNQWIGGEQIVPPLTLSILSATLPPDVTDVFPEPSQRQLALDHPELQKRITASKLAELVVVNPKRGFHDALVVEAAQRATRLADNGRNRIAIMVNRVATAGQIASQLRGEDNVDVVLMTGRMRPIDRDEMVARWSPFLKAGSNVQPDRPIIVVTTQCLEVGADFSFDALITECASLDALRQRFGRLNRLGHFDTVDAAVLIRKAQVKPDEKLNPGKPLDRIYGNAIAHTWNWLVEHTDEKNRFGFGIDQVNQAIRASESKTKFSLSTLNAPSKDAPVMLPAHVDLLCQTAPQPTPDPDVGIFLHGPQRSAPQVSVVFRADLLDHLGQRNWIEAVGLLPPLSGEALALPLWLLRKWLGGGLSADDAEDLADVETQQGPEKNTEVGHDHAFVIWRGKRQSVLSNDPDAIRPNEIIVVPADEAFISDLGDAFCRPEGTPLDVVERAYLPGRNQHVLRLLPSVFRHHGLAGELSEIEPLRALMQWAKSEDRERAEFRDLLSSLHGHASQLDGNDPVFPAWLRDGVASLSKLHRIRILPHPSGGVIVVGSDNNSNHIPFDLDFADIDDSLSANEESWLLSEHTEHVVKRAKTWAQRSLPPQVADALAVAAKLHDGGKADPRFQIVLHGDEVEAAVALQSGRILAKSNGLFRPASIQRKLREVASLPKDFRHEMLSVQLAETVSELLPNEDVLRELTLHLISSHHGHARPFAPICLDDDLPEICSLPELGIGEGFSVDQRRSLIPPHRLDSGVPDRFWKLTRHYGWWGLAYLESVLRLADRAASAAEARPSRLQQNEVTT